MHRNSATRKSGGLLPPLAMRLLNAPLAIHPQSLDVILAGLGAGTDFPASDQEVMQIPRSQRRSDGIAVIPVHGFLTKRSSGLDALFGLTTSYADIGAAIQSAVADPNCSAILLDCDSEGGAPGSLLDLCDFLYSMRGQKPIISIADDQALSAAYAVASCADKVLTTSMGACGGVGVAMIHCDQSQFDKQQGLNFTYVFSGHEKIAWNPHQSLSKSALAEAQRECDRVRGMLCQTIASNRNVSEQAIYDTEAGVFMGSQAVPLLADAVGSLDDAIELAASIGRGSRSFAIPRGRALGRPADRQIATLEGRLRRLTSSTDSELEARLRLLRLEREV